VDEPFRIIFGGGEPLLFKKELIELISFSEKQGYSTSLATSGYLIDEEFCRQVSRAGLSNIALTMYSLDEKTHDFLRIKGSYKKLMESINNLNRFSKGLSIAIDTVIMAPNLGDIINLTQWVFRNKVLSAIFFQAVVQPFHTPPIKKWYNSNDFGFLWPGNNGRVQSVIDELIEIKRRSLVNGTDRINNPVNQLEAFKRYFSNAGFIKRTVCNVLSGSIFVISPDGDLRLCPYMEPLGNIKRDKFKDIWNSQQGDKLHRQIISCKKNCHHIVNCWYEEDQMY